jgi:hypothetical protein
MLAEAGEKLRDDLGRLVHSLKLGFHWEVVSQGIPKMDGQLVITWKIGKKDQKGRNVFRGFAGR